MLLQIQDLVLLPGMDYALRVGRLSEEELSVLHEKSRGCGGSVKAQPGQI